MNGSEWAWLIVTAILNVAIGYVFVKLFRSVSVTQVVAEKSQDVAAGAQNESSSSRVIGFAGGMVMTCFVWAIANIIVYLGLTDPEKVNGFIGSIGGFLLSGSALFLPYAVNRLTDVGKAATQSNADTSKKAEEEKKAEEAKRAKAADDAKAEAAKAIDALGGTLTPDQAKELLAGAVQKAAGTK